MLFKRNSLPTEPAQLLRAVTSERAVAWINYPSVVVEDQNPAELVKDAWIIATAKYLVLIKGDTKQSWPWHLVDRAAWDPQTNQLMVLLVESPAPLVITITDKTPIKLLTFLRERVDHSVVMSESVVITMTQTARVAVRRTDTDGLIIQTVYDPGVNPNAAAVTRKVAPVIDRLRDMSGAA